MTSNISNQIKFLKIRGVHDLVIDGFRYENNSKVSSIIPALYNEYLVFYKIPEIITIDRLSDVIEIKNIHKLIQDYELMDETSFILTHGRNPFGLNEYTTWIGIILDELKSNH